MTRKTRVYRQGVSVYVIGTDDAQEACRAAGISPETHRWAATDYGLFVRRQGYWQARSDYLAPKDARPGVCFVGPIRERREE